MSNSLNFTLKEMVEHLTHPCLKAARASGVFLNKDTVVLNRYLIDNYTLLSKSSRLHVFPNILCDFEKDNNSVMLNYSYNRNTNKFFLKHACGRLDSSLNVNWSYRENSKELRKLLSKIFTEKDLFDKPTYKVIPRTTSKPSNPDQFHLW